MNRIWTALLLLVIVAASVAGCREDSDSPDDESRSAEDILADARERWDETDSAHFTLDVEGEAYLDSDRTIRLRSAEGDIQRPGSVNATAQISVMLLALDMSLISVDGDMYMTNFVSGRWERAPDDFSYDPSILFSDTSGIGPVLTELRDPTNEGSERLDGRDTVKVSGTVDATAVDEITAGAIQGDDIPVTLWIGVESNDIYRVTLTEPEGVSDEPATWTLDLSNHDEPVTIEPPPV